MDIQRLAGIVMIVGFVVFWAGNVYSPPGVYGETAVAARLEVVAQNPVRWAISQGMGGLGIVVMLLGLILWSIPLRGQHSSWLAVLPAVINMLAAILITVYLYQYITAPAFIWESAQPSLLLQAATALTLVAGLLYGLLFLQAGLPVWLGYVVIGYAVIATAALFLFNPPAFYLISLYGFIVLAAGIVLVRQ
jgi:hypothetical protein